MKFIPHEYQQYSIDFIKNNKIAALLLEMGLGKTVTTLTAIKDLMHDDFSIKKVLIVAPLRVAQSTWPNEIEKWDHLKDLTYSVVLGTPKQRKEALWKKADLYLINRENLDWLITKSGFDFDFDMVVIDELSSFKNYKAKRFTSLMQVRHKVDRIVGLTGTPSSNGLMDLFAEFKSWIWVSAWNITFRGIEISISYRISEMDCRFILGNQGRMRNRKSMTRFRTSPFP